MPHIPDDEDGTPFWLSRWPFLEPPRLPLPDDDET